jgi:hypothetical protein
MKINSIVDAKVEIPGFGWKTTLFKLRFRLDRATGLKYVITFDSEDHIMIPQSGGLMARWTKDQQFTLNDRRNG